MSTGLGPTSLEKSLPSAYYCSAEIYEREKESIFSQEWFCAGREEDLPANTRILKPTDGITDMRANPNRLTIVIGEDGRIVDAIWD